MTGGAADAMERERPGGLPYTDYFRFVTQFHRTEDELRAIPLSSGPRFILA